MYILVLFLLTEEGLMGVENSRQNKENTTNIAQTSLHF